MFAARNNSLKNIYKNLVGEGFDPPSYWSLANHAASAPTRLTIEILVPIFFGFK